MEAPPMKRCRHSARPDSTGMAEVQQIMLARRKSCRAGQEGRRKHGKSSELAGSAQMAEVQQIMLASRKSCGAGQETKGRWGLQVCQNWVALAGDMDLHHTHIGRLRDRECRHATAQRSRKYHSRPALSGRGRRGARQARSAAR